MKTFAITALALPLLGALAPAQGLFDAARFATARGSVAEPWAPFNAGSEKTAIGVGDWIEVDLPVDENARPYQVVQYAVGIQSSAFPLGVDVEFYLKPDLPGASWVSVSTQNLNGFSMLYDSLALRQSFPAVAARLEVRTIHFGGTIWLDTLRAYAPKSSRHLEQAAYSWYGAPPLAGALAVVDVRVEFAAGDDFGLLLNTVGSPLLSSPIQLSVFSQGGLLLDPNNVFALEVRPLLGAMDWRLAASYFYDPALAGIEWNVQAVMVDFLTTGVPVLSWTRPVTFNT